jgi:hypothetical protein
VECALLLVFSLRKLLNLSINKQSDIFLYIDTLNFHGLSQGSLIALLFIKVHKTLALYFFLKKNMCLSHMLHLYIFSINIKLLAI